MSKTKCFKCRCEFKSRELTKLTYKQNLGYKEKDNIRFYSECLRKQLVCKECLELIVQEWEKQNEN